LPPERVKGKVFLILLIFCLASFLWSTFEFINFERDRVRTASDIENLARLKTILASKKIDASLLRIEEAVRSLAKNLKEGKNNEIWLRERLKTVEAENPLIYQISVLYQPFALNSGTRLRSPTCNRQNDKIVFLQDGYSGDYTRTPWYKKTLSDAANWLEPHFERGGTRLATGFAAPFPEGKKGAAGLVRATLSMEGLNDLMGSLELGKTGYGFILSSRGAYIYHPVSELVAGQRSVFKISKAPTKVEEKILDLTRKALRGERGALRFYNKETDQIIRLVYQSLSTTRWCLGAFFVESELSPAGIDFRRQMIRICLGLIAFLSSLTALLSRAFELRRQGLWMTALAFSALCLAASFFILFLAREAPLQRNPDDIMMVDRAGLRKFMTSTSHLSQILHGKRAIFIPTGILIKTLAFVEANNLRVSGYIWQKYQDGVHDGISRSFILPEAENVELKETYRCRKGRTETIGWTFEASIRETFDYSKYPLDRPDTRIWLMPKDFEKEIVLTPDLDAYKITAPIARPGLQNEINLRGFNIMGTYFNYRPQLSNTDYGVSNHARANIMPELYFNIIARRNILTPFVSFLFPLLLILCLLFIVQMKFSQDEEKKTAFGLRGLTVIAIIISFLFPAFISQVSLRQGLSSDSVTFLENFYFVIYFLLLLVAVNAYFFTAHKNLRFIHFEDGLLPKLFYWPIFSLLALVITLFHFY